MGANNHLTVVPSNKQSKPLAYVAMLRGSPLVTFDQQVADSWYMDGLNVRKARTLGKLELLLEECGA